VKFRVTMKDPDTLHDAITEAVALEVDKIDGLDSDERDAVREERGEKVRAVCAKWFEYDEYLCVEIDTDADTCTVVKK
jgi:hypothetical protein